MIEKVHMNDEESTLIIGVINDLIRSFAKRERLPYLSISHFKDFANNDNTVKVKLTGLNSKGIESFAFLLIADKLMELRPSYKESLGDKVSIDGSKSLSDEDVWYSHVEVIDEQTVTMNFIVLTFEVREKMKQYVDGSRSDRLPSNLSKIS